MAAAKTPKVKGTKTTKARTTATEKVHTGRYVNEEADDEEVHDFGPWIVTPKSSRVDSFRYDFAARLIHVKWRDGGREYVYTEVPYEIYRAMIRITSKGKFINMPLGAGYDFRKAKSDETSAPSNDERTAPGSRANYAGAQGKA